jgi:hypothetical protein
MTEDIMPDTSFYTDTPSRLRALALVFDREKGTVAQCGTGPCTQRKWADVTASGLSYDLNVCVAVFRGDADYRIKPKPRELWITFATTGLPVSADPVAPEIMRQGYTLARFLEQPE